MLVPMSVARENIPALRLSMAPCVVDAPYYRINVPFSIMTRGLNVAKSA